MNWLICWISRLALTLWAPMISSTSARSPQKTCGLFDTGFAGGSLDVTSQDSLGISDLFSAAATYSIDDPNKASTSKLALNDPILMDNWDILDPLGDLEADHLADDSLDAFVNLDKILTGDPFFEDIAEVNPVIEIAPSEMKQCIDEFFSASSAMDSSDIVHINESPPSTLDKPRKRKLQKVSSKETFKTSYFEIPAKAIVLDTGSDHDYTTKLMKMSQESIPVSNPKKATAGVSTSISLAPANENCITDKQAVRRMKNNVASKRSREQRKQKFVEMDQEAEQLIIANENLRKQIVELEKLAQEMKAELVAKMSGK